MANYLYNGVDLPKVPDGYVHYYIHHPPNGKYYVMCANDVLVAEYSTLGRQYFIRPKESTENAIYVLNSGEWVLDSENQTRTIGNGVWASHDMYYLGGDLDGTLYLAASTPVPVVTNTLDPTALLMGWLVGKRVAGLRKTQTDVPVVPDEPIAYLYNGVRLPDINAVWTDKTAYPYAVIAQFDVIAMYLSTKPFYVDASGELCIAEVGPMSIYVNDSGWQLAETIIDCPANEPIFGADAVFWASADILNTDGTTYLASSEPVPVYE